MKVRYGNGTTVCGPGVDIELTGCDVAVAIDAYLVAKGIHVSGPRTIRVNGELCECGSVYVDPSGFVIKNGHKYSGRGPADSETGANRTQQGAVTPCSCGRVNYGPIICAKCGGTVWQEF